MKISLVTDECAIDQCSFIKCLHGGKCLSTSCLCPLGFGGKFCDKKLDLKVTFNGLSNDPHINCIRDRTFQIPMFNGTSNLRYAPLGETAIIWLELKVCTHVVVVVVDCVQSFIKNSPFQVAIKPHSKDGLILFSGKNDLGDFIALYLNFGKQNS